MGLEKVKGRVLKEAEQKAERRVKEVQAEADGLVSSAREKLRERSEVFEMELSEQVALIRRREKASANLELNKVILAFRKRLAEDVFESAKKNLKELPQKDHEHHLKELLKKANEELEVGVIHCNKRDDKHISKKYVVKHSNILGGLIAESKNHELRVDYSYDAILESLKEDLIPNINKVLFEKK